MYDRFNIIPTFYRRTDRNGKTLSCSAFYAMTTGINANDGLKPQKKSQKYDK